MTTDVCAKSPAGLAIVGRKGGTNIGQSLYSAAISLGLDVDLFDDKVAYSGVRFVDAVFWRCIDRRPVYQNRFETLILSGAASGRFSTLISSGLNPLRRKCLSKLRDMGVFCMHFSSDDPWNPGLYAKWFLDSLSAYQLVFTPRTSNMAQLEVLLPGRVHWLPFAYDHIALGSYSAMMPCASNLVDSISSGLLFVGGADQARSEFVSELCKLNVPVYLVGDYWSRFKLGGVALGHKPPDLVAQLTRNACVNLIVPRRINRDGHTMRSFEAAALGGCLLVERTPEHQAIYGTEGECVLYYSDPLECSEKFFKLRSSPLLRDRMSEVIMKRFLSSESSYAHRLITMLRASSNSSTFVA